MAYVKPLSLITPKGTAVYPRIIDGEPDTKFDADGVYKITLRIDANDPATEKLVETLREVYETNADTVRKERKGKKTKIADFPVVTETDDDGDETGYLLVSAKLKAKVNKKDGGHFMQSPALFDAKGKRFYPDSVWGGSVCKISVEVIPFFTAMAGAGISLRLKAVQIISLVTGTTSASDFGFDEEEGFEADDSLTTRQTLADTKSSGADDDDETEDDDDYDY